MTAFKKMLCKIGIHKKQYCSAPFVLLGKQGTVQAWVCGKCGYKHTKGKFISN